MSTDAVLHTSTAHLIGTHGHSDVLLRDLVVPDVPHIVPGQLQYISRDVLQHRHDVHRHLMIDLITQNLLQERERETSGHTTDHTHAHTHARTERERERERETHTHTHTHTHKHTERERLTHTRTHTHTHTHTHTRTE